MAVFSAHSKSLIHCDVFVVVVVVLTAYVKGYLWPVFVMELELHCL